MTESEQVRPEVVAAIVAALQATDPTNLPDDAAQVLEQLATIEREVQRDDGRWYLVRLLPYRRLDQYIDGVVLTFVDIDQRKLAEQARLEAENARIREAAARQAEKEQAAAAKAAEKDRAAEEKAAARQAREEPGLVTSVVKSSAFKSMLRSAGTVIGREITRSVFGNSRRR